MAARIRARDWSATLGPPASWPQSLKTTVGLLIHSPVPMVLLWGAGGIMIYNDAYGVFAGNRHPGLLGMKVLEAWPEAADLNAEVMRVGMSGGTLEFKDRELALNRHGAPEAGWMDLFYSPVIDESGKPGGVIAVVMETTERVLAARDLAESEQRLQTALSAGRGVGTWDWDVPRDRVVADARFATLYGVDPDLARAGAPIAEFFTAMHADDRDRVMSQVQQALKTGARFNAIYRLIQQDGSIRWVEAEGRCTLDAQGAPLRFPGVSFDVTEMMREQSRRAALAELSDRVRDIDDPEALAYAAAEILGRALNVSRAGYGTVNPAAETITIARDWNAPGVKSLAGVLQFRDYGSYIEDLKRGETAIVTDAFADPRTAATADALKAISAQAFINMPVSEDGGLVALLYLNHETAREWPDEEIAFVREAAERTRTAVERRRAEAELRANESRLRFLDSLGNETARSLDADAILAVTTRRLGEYLDVSVCAYGDMDTDEDGCTIRGEWTRPGVPSHLGHYRLADFGALAVTQLAAGRPLVLHDNGAELPPDEAAAFQALGIRATVCMPLVREGRLTALMAIHDGKPRTWTADEQALITEVTARSWAHIERARAVGVVQASENQFRTMAQAMPNHVWTAAPDGLLDWLNHQAYAYSGAAPGALIGNAWTEIVHPDDLDAAATAWSAALAAGRVYETEFRLRGADGVYRWHIARAVPVRDSAGTVVRWIGTNTDIQDQKELNETLEQRVRERTSQLAQTEDALRQAQKMEAVGQLTGGIAHDFNNLLQGITGALDRVQHRIAQGRTGDVERFLKAAIESANRAASLTHRLLAFSRRQTLDPRAVDANRLIGGMEELIRRTMGPTVAVEVVGAGGLWPILVDASQLENSLLNLSINARDAMPQGGKLTIETANKWLDERAARERDLPPGQYVSLCVTDSGTGMAPEVVARAFDPFFTTKPLGQGTGLGLSMIYGFVRQSGGQVRVYSEEAKGTTMCLYFPRHMGEVENDAVPTSEIVERGFGETVLVVDDEPTVRMLVAEILSESYYNILEAGDGPSALKILESDRRIDLMITDVGLPGGMNGRQVADAARVVRKALKVLFITGYAENAAVGNGHLDPGMEILAKPFAMSTLANKVREMIES